MSDDTKIQNDPHQVDVPDLWHEAHPLPGMPDPAPPFRPMHTDVVFKEGDVAKVWLVDHPINAVRTIALQARGYSQVYTPDIDPEEVTQYNDEIARTRLQTPLDGIWINLLIQNVTRSFTHQLVRYRIGTSFVQESLRYFRDGTVFVRVPNALNQESLARYPGRETKRIQYESAIRTSIYTYFDLLEEENGEPPLERQDARGTLPHDVLTNVFFNASLRTIAHIYGQRTCCQAQQEEWNNVLAQIKELLTKLDPLLGDWLKAPWESGRSSCGFNASFDRPCAFADLFRKPSNP